MTRNDTGIDSCPRHLRLLFDYARQAAQLVESGEVSRESLGRSVVHQLAATKALELVGEQAWLLDREGVDLGEGIDLATIAGMRHRMVHHYDGIDWSLVEEALFEDILELVKRLSELATRGQDTRDANAPVLCPDDAGELG